MRRILGMSVLLAGIVVAVAALGGAQESTPTEASKSGGGTCGFNVTSILYDKDSNNVPFQFQSDGLGPYTAYSNGRHDSVLSSIDGNCGWSMYTTGSKSRGISITLAYPDGRGSPPPFTNATVVKGRINTHCATNNANNGVDVGSMTTVGQTLICPFNVAFYAPNGNWYNIGLNPFNWPGTTMAQVTCTGASGGQCNQWTILPDPASPVVDPATGQVSSIGELTLPPCVGCGGGTALGEYYFAYSFLIHK